MKPTTQLPYLSLITPPIPLVPDLLKVEPSVLSLYPMFGGFHFKNSAVGFPISVLWFMSEKNSMACMYGILIFIFSFLLLW